MVDINLPIIEKGAVTFLDVLGWKGIWQQNISAIEKLQSLVRELDKKAEDITNKYSEKDTNLRGKTKPTVVLSISDTIAVFTSAKPEVAIKIHSEICSWALEYALDLELPLRGAISYGQYTIADNIMLGYAVDESASWHESTEWIGVVLTPSAQIELPEERNGFDCIVQYDRIPFKTGIGQLCYCVQWSFNNKKRLYEVIKSKGPLVPGISQKYLNTLNFFESLVKKESNVAEEAKTEQGDIIYIDGLSEPQKSIGSEALYRDTTDMNSVEIKEVEADKTESKTVELDEQHDINNDSPKTTECQIGIIRKLKRKFMSTKRHRERD